MLPLLLLLCVLIMPAISHAETKVLTAEATYTMGDGESPSFAEAMVLQKAKQMALEQAGTYVESYTKTKNYDLTHDEIQTIAGGVLQVEVLEKTRTLVGDGLRFYIKIKATVTTDKMEELAQRIKGKNVAEEYKKLQEDYARLNKEIETWKQLIAKTPTGLEREAALEQIQEQERAFASLQQSEATFFHRLVSGESLVKKAQDERHIVDALFQKIVEQGHLITIGAPTSHKIKDNPIRVKLRVPVTLRARSTIRSAIEETARSIDGETWSGEFQRSIRGIRRKVNAAIIRMGADAEVAGYFQQRVSALNFVLKLHLEDGDVLVCQHWDANTYPAQEYYLGTNPIAPVYGVYKRYGWGSLRNKDVEEVFEDYDSIGLPEYKSPVRWLGKDDVLLAGSPAPLGKTFERSPESEVVVFDDVRSFTVTTVIYTALAQQIKAITGEYAEGTLQEEVLASIKTPPTSQTDIQRQRSWWERLFQADKETKEIATPVPQHKMARRLNCTIEP